MCGCRSGSGRRSTTNQMGRNMTQFTDTADFVEIQYYGAGYTHLVGSPTGVIRQYGILNYGTHKRGDIFMVHVKDVEKDGGQKFIPTTAPVQVQQQTPELEIPELEVQQEEENSEEERIVVEEEKPKRRRTRSNNET